MVGKSSERVRNKVITFVDSHVQSFIASMNWEGKTIGAAVLVEVEECFIHCPRAFHQAGLWDTETWAKSEELPSIYELFHAHLKINGLN